MLILTQDRRSIVNTDRFDVLTVHTEKNFDGGETSEIIAIKLLEAEKDGGEDYQESLGLYMKDDTAEEVLFQIADAARTGQTGYIMPD